MDPIITLIALAAGGVALAAAKGGGSTAPKARALTSAEAAGRQFYGVRLGAQGINSQVGAAAPAGAGGTVSHAETDARNAAIGAGLGAMGANAGCQAAGLGPQAAKLCEMGGAALGNYVGENAREWKNDIKDAAGDAWDRMKFW